MDTKKIGKFIAYNRKRKGLTQKQLAQILQVSDKTISRWENGNYMPDLSLLKPLSETLDITLNELLSGEPIESKNLQEQTESTIIKTIDYSNQKINHEHQIVAVILMITGALISFSSLTILNHESSWCAIYSIIGMIIFVIGIYKILNLAKIKKTIITIVLFCLIFSIFYLFDYLGVKNEKRPPIYSYKIETRFIENKEIAYYTLFYNVFRINADSTNEYYLIDPDKKYTFENIPLSPFNRNKSGIENLIKYQNLYLGNNSNTGNLINSLPLSQYGYVFEIDSANYALTIDYHITDWYINDDLYLAKSLIYNSVSIFALIDNVQSITYNFSGNSYQIAKETIINTFPNYSKIISDKTINKNNFNLYLEAKMNDDDFVTTIFPIFTNKA